jgi:hypothetical protein
VLKDLGHDGAELFAHLHDWIQLGTYTGTVISGANVCEVILFQRTFGRKKISKGGKCKKHCGSGSATLVVCADSGPPCTRAFVRWRQSRLLRNFQRWAKFRPSELPILTPIFRLYRPIFLVDFNTWKIASSLQNEDLLAIQSLHRIKRYLLC